MDNTKKPQIKMYLSWISLAALVVLLTAMPLLAGSGVEEDGPEASILSGTVETGSIETALHGGGILASPEQRPIDLPSGVKLQEFLVGNGQYVEEGTPLALVDRVSVMSAITGVQETMDHLLEQMNEAEEEQASGEVIAPAGGRVKQVFAKTGETVQDVMLRSGALAVLSLDGRMAVRMETECPLSTGTAVTVLLSDGTPVEGRIESNLHGVVAVTVEDKGYPVGEPVTVTETGGSPIGTGELYIHNAWKAVAYTGVIDGVRIEPEDTVDPEDVLFTLSDTGYTAARDALARQHAKYSELMLRLFQMYQSETIDAPCSGVVSGIDSDSIHLLTNNSGGIALDLLINAPNGDDETLYLNFAGIVTGVDGLSWNLSMDLTPLTVTDYRDLSGLTLDPAKMTQPVMFVPTVPVYELAEGQWAQIDPVSVLPGDYLLIAMDTNGNFVWVVRITEENRTPQPPVETEPTVPSTEPEEPSQPTVPVIPPVTQPALPSDPTAPSEPSADPTVPTVPSVPDFQYPSIQIPNGFWGSIGGYGDYGSYSTVPEEPEFELFDLEGDTLMTLTEQETMTLTIILDEQDIAKVASGQQAEVRVEAIPGELFPALITGISRTGTNSGGSSKFTMELTLEKTASMLPGMSAVASIPLSVVEDVPVVPLAALAEQGADTILYTGYDEENGLLTGPVKVTTGLSDGTFAQVLTGLEPGDSFFYAYYDVLELSTEVDSQRSPFG